MSAQQAEGWTRRHFLGGLTLTGASGLLSLHAQPVAAEPPPETTTLRLDQRPSLCSAPKYVHVSSAGHGTQDDIRTHVAGQGLRSDAGLACASCRVRIYRPLTQGPRADGRYVGLCD
jgi:hypothetical protein